MPKYETAFYLNNDGQWEEVSFGELRSEERRAELRERDLRNESDGQIELGIRNHEQTPHFFAKKRLRTDLDPGAKESFEHEDRKRMLNNFLSKYEKHKFGYYEKPWDRKDNGFDTLVKIKDYSWDVEVSFGLVYGKFIRFDLLGRSKNELGLTDKHPYIAVEVVDTHFHSQEAFCALLESSKNIPIIIVYYFSPVAPHLNCVYKPKSEKFYSKIRLQYYIADGSFWNRNDRIEDSYDITPDQPEVYYNLIREKLYTEGCISRPGEPRDQPNQ